MPWIVCEPKRLWEKKLRKGKGSIKNFSTADLAFSFGFSLFRSQRPHRIGAHRAKCRKIESDQ